MPHRFQISRDSQALFITINTKNRLPVFRKDEIKKVLCQAIDEARKSAALLLFAYAIMIDHLHVITDQPRPISEVLRVLKGITARRVIDYLKDEITALPSQNFSTKCAIETTDIRFGRLRRMFIQFSVRDSSCKR
jgi:REP element-mobilizing transposase RayT